MVRETLANDEFKDKTTAPNQLWQTDFTPAFAGAGSISVSDSKLYST